MKAFFKIAIILFASLPVGAAHADTKSILDLARDLGHLQAAEKFCGMRYDIDEMRALIARTVDDYTRFVPWFEGYEKQGKLNQGTMTAGERDAYCAQISRLASQYKILD